MQPCAVLAANLGDQRHGIDTAARRRADRRDHRHRSIAQRNVLDNRSPQCAHVHTVRGIARDANHVVFTKPEHHHRLVDGAVRLLGRVHPQHAYVTTTCHSAPPYVRARRFARGRECVKHGDGRRVIHDAEHRGRQSNQVAKPREHERLEFRRRRRCLPRHRAHVERRRQDFTQQRRPVARTAEVAEKGGVAPVHDARHHLALEVLQDRLDRFAVHGH